MNSEDNVIEKNKGLFTDKYGIELVLDLHGCDSLKFTRKSISKYFEELCVLIDMKREELYFWDRRSTGRL